MRQSDILNRARDAGLKIYFDETDGTNMRKHVRAGAQIFLPAPHKCDIVGTRTREEYIGNELRPLEYM
jgi:hypothetical protein